MKYVSAYAPQCTTPVENKHIIAQHMIKKIDVYKGYVFICSKGDIRYSDNPTYLEVNKELAENRRMLYHKRNKKDNNIKGTRGYYALNILW